MTQPPPKSSFALRHWPGAMLFALACLQAAQAQAPQRPADFVDAATVVPGLIVEMRYAGSHNFIGQPVDGYRRRIVC